MYKLLYLLLAKSSILVGGQAVIEGVMMRVPGAYATAVRLKDNTIKIKRNTFTSLIEKKKMHHYYIIRGMIHLYESMKMGYQTLDWSANMNDDDYKEEKSITFYDKMKDTIASLFSIVFAVSLFLLLPLFFTFYFEDIINQPFIFNFISGIIRISIFLLYLILIAQLKDVKTLFRYHGAEHKVVYNFESGETLTTKNAKRFPTQHPRCGTSFVFIIMLVTIFTHAILDSIALIFINELTILIRFSLHIICLPLVAGIGYEVLKFLSTRQSIVFFSILSKPGLWLQNITTKEPTDLELEVSIAALESAFGKNKIKDFKGQLFKAEAIG
jgi:uncharacterized protein YqhQ